MEEYLIIWLLIRIEGIFVEVVGDLISSTVVLLVFRERELEASQPLISSKQLFSIDMLVDLVSYSIFECRQRMYGN